MSAWEATGSDKCNQQNQLITWREDCKQSVASETRAHQERLLILDRQWGGGEGHGMFSDRHTPKLILKVLPR